MVSLKKNNKNYYSPLVSEDELNKLHAQIEKLITYHNNILEEENIMQNINRVLKWVENCEDGLATAERKLYEEGLQILEDANARLKLALEEQQRIIEESPTASVNARGRKVEKLAKASSHTNEALSTLSNITGPNERK